MMNIEELYETDLWQRLTKNTIFFDKFNEVINRCNYYAREADIKLNINDNKIIVSYNIPIRERELNCQTNSEVYFEFFLDEEDNLIINEKSGTMRSNYGYDFANSEGGVLDTHYSCSAFDPEGIELAYQGYNDTIKLDKDSFDTFKEGYFSAINDAFNPNLDRYANKVGVYPKANVIGSNSRFIRQIRSKDNLGIVICSNCQFDNTGKVINSKEEYFFNTFLSQQSAMRPEMISHVREYPFAYIDDEFKMRFTNTYRESGLNRDNYEEVAKERFLRELLEDQQTLGRHAPKEVQDKYNLMINRLQRSVRNEKGMK